MAITVTFSVYPKLQFVGNNISFSADVLNTTPLPFSTSAYTVLFGDGQTSAVTASSTVTATNEIIHSYTNQGTYTSFHNYLIQKSLSILHNQNGIISNIRMNALPDIDFLGNPTVSAVINFYDARGGYYITDTIVSADWNFGDGLTSSTTDLDATLEHTYYTAGNYTIGLSAYDISGNVGTDSTIFAVLESSACKAKEDYITLCGPDVLGRFGESRKINLVEYLPDYLKGGETEDFLVLFEEFLNEMYQGYTGWQLSASAIDVVQDWSISNSATISATVNQNFSYTISGVSAATDATDVEQYKLYEPTNAAYVTSAQRISILEKINRLTELHDPSLIDLEYIQFFASNLGYSVNVSRDEVGVSGTSENFGTTEFGGACSAADVNRYLRFVVENLPTWYKIKTTRNSIKVMLYSFGLIGDLIEYFTDSYMPTSDGGKWRTDYSGKLTEIDNNWFPTPHFEIYVDFDKSSDVSFEITRRTKVIRAIESIRPINTVFRGLVGMVTRYVDLQAACYVRSTRYTVIESNGNSNGWGG